MDTYNNPYGAQPGQAAPGAGSKGVPIPPKPDNYLVWAILSTLCCCLPFGIVSIVYAAKVNGLYASAQYAAAQQAAADAKKWALIALVCGLVINGIYMIWYFTVGMAALYHL